MEETLAEGDMATAGPMGPGPPGPGGPVDYPLPEGMPEGMGPPGMEEYPYDPEYEYPGTMSPDMMMDMHNQLFFIKAHSGLWHIWYNLYFYDRDADGEYDASISGGRMLFMTGGLIYHGLPGVRSGGPDPQASQR